MFLLTKLTTCKKPSQNFAMPCQYQRNNRAGKKEDQKYILQISEDNLCKRKN